MNLKRRILSIAVAVTMVFTLATTANADTTEWALPQSPTDLGSYDNIVTMAAHGSATTSALFMGYNLTTYRSDDMGREVKGSTAADKLASARTSVAMAAFGSNLNTNPDPYMANYLYNLYADAEGLPMSEDGVYLTSAGLAPWTADITPVTEFGTSYALARRPDVLLGTDAATVDNTAVTYADEIAKLPENTDEDAANDYNPVEVSYSCNSMYDLSDTLYKMAEIPQALGKNGRYGDPMETAEKYEALLKGMQLYVRSQIDAGKVEEKTVAVISWGSSRGVSYAEDTDGNEIYDKFVLNPNSPQTKFSRTLEWLQNVTKNAADCGLANDGYITAKEIAENCDIVYVQGLQGVTSPTADQLYEAIKNEAGVDKLDLECYVANPSTVFAVGQSNSVENIEGLPLTIGYAYPELINPVYGAMYIYQNFWHVNPSYLTSLANRNFANASLPEGINRSGDGYSEADVQGIINAGLKYGQENSDKIDNPNLKSTTLDVNTFIAANPGNDPNPPVVDPTEPTQPSVDPTNPTDPTQPSVDPTEPTAPTKPSVDPTKPSVIKKDISGRTAKIGKVVYTGKERKPAVTIKGLTQGTDFTVKYTNNIKCGLATATITGKGKYTGKLTKKFVIYPKSAAISKLTPGIKKFTVTVKNQKASGVTGYQIAYKLTTSKKSYYTYCTTLNKKTITKNLKSGKKYYVKVRAYKTISGTKKFGAFSKTLTVKIK